MNPQLEHTLLHNNLRRTLPRQLVFEVLASSPALTINELLSRVESKLDRASLYRTLSLFRRLGIVQDVVIAGQRKVELTDRYGTHHHHIACNDCGKTQAINDVTLEKRIDEIAAKYGFTHQNHSFEISGICKGCYKP